MNGQSTRNTPLIHCFLSVILLVSACAKEKPLSGSPIFVSILPQAYFVERILGSENGGRVEVMVGPGQSPTTYEPTPQQMMKLTNTKLYFAIGVPFEHIWIDRIKATNPNLIIIDTSKGTAKRDIEHAGYTSDTTHHTRKDPHIWLDPILVKAQARIMAQALAETEPGHTAEYQANLKAFLEDLDRLDLEIKAILKDLESRTFFVFHPSWGYFADRYGLRQVPVEVGGKEPGARGLGRFVEEAKTLIHQGGAARVLFVQKQFSTKTAETVARSIGARIVTLDPLAKDYLSNLRNTALVIMECGMRNAERGMRSAECGPHLYTSTSHSYLFLRLTFP